MRIAHLYQSVKSLNLAAVEIAQEVYRPTYGAAELLRHADSKIPLNLVASS